MKSTKLRICFVCNEYPPFRHGGIGTMTQVLGRALVAAGHSVRVVGLYEAEQSACVRESDQGVEIWRIQRPLRRGGWIWGRRSLYLTIREWSVRGEIDIVEVPDWEGMAAGWPSLPVPVLARLNGSAAFFRHELGNKVGGMGVMLERRSARRVDAWCAVTNYVAEVSQPLLRLRGRPVEILSNPVELQAAGTLDRRSSQDVVFTGTLTAKKGILVLAEVWPAVRARCPQAVLHVFGKDEYPNAAKLLAAGNAGAEKSEGGSVRIHGHVPREQLLAALKSARVGVFPSFAESFGIAPIESMMCGCPTIYSLLGPGPELLRNRLDALLIDPRRPEQLELAIVELLREADFANTLGAEGRRTAMAKYSVDSLLPRNIECYERCLSSFAGRS